MQKYIFAIFILISGQLWAAQMGPAEKEQYLKSLQQSNPRDYNQAMFNNYSRSLQRIFSKAAKQYVPLDIAKEILKHNKSYAFYKVATLKVQYAAIALSSKGILAFSESHENAEIVGIDERHRRRPTSIKFWDIKNNKVSDFEIPIDQMLDYVFKWSPDGSMLAIQKGAQGFGEFPRQGMSIWDYQNRSKIYEIPELEPMFGKNGEDYNFWVRIKNFAWSPDSSKLAVIEEGYHNHRDAPDPQQFRLKIYDIKNRTSLVKQDFLGIEAYEVYWFKNNSLALSGVVRKDYKSHGNGALNSYDIDYQKNKLILRIYMPLNYRYLTYISDDGSRLVTVENKDKSNVEVFDTHDFELIATQELDQLIDLENGSAQKIRLSENNNILAIEIIDESGSYIALIDLERNILIKKISISLDVSQIPRRLNRLNFIWSTEPNSMYLAVYNGNDPNDPSIDIWQGIKLK